MTSNPTTCIIDVENCERLNEFFTNAWKSCKQPDISSHTTRLDKIQPIRIHEPELLEQLEKLDIKKAPGPDGIPPSLLKAAQYELSGIISHLMNLSLKNYVLPDEWKLANIVPIPKESKPTELSHYRPVALTSTL